MKIIICCHPPITASKLKLFHQTFVNIVRSQALCYELTSHKANIYPNNQAYYQSYILYKCLMLFVFSVFCALKKRASQECIFKDHETHFKCIFLGVLLCEIRELLVTEFSSE